MKRVSVQILFGRFEKFGSQGRCSDQDLQSRPQRSIAVDNSNCSSVIGHGLSPTILLESQGGRRRQALSSHLPDIAPIGTGPHAPDRYFSFAFIVSLPEICKRVIDAVDGRSWSFLSPAALVGLLWFDQIWQNWE